MKRYGQVIRVKAEMLEKNGFGSQNAGMVEVNRSLSAAIGYGRAW